MKRSLEVSFVGVLMTICVLTAGCSQAVAPKGAEPSPAGRAAQAAIPPTLAVIGTLPGAGSGRWDLLTIDSKTQRVYVARQTRVSVFDAAKGGMVGEVADVPGAHGVALVPERGLGFATAGKDNTIRVFDLKTLSTVRTIKAGTGPDAILYDPSSKKVLAFNHRSGDITIVDPAALDKAPDTLAVGGALEAGVADGAYHVYVNVEDKSEVVAIDTRTMKVLAHWPLAPGEEPTGLAIDSANRRLFAGCGNKMMIVLNADTGKVLGNVPIGAGVDGVAFDSHWALALSSNGRDGTATAVGQASGGQFVAVQTIPTAKGARTIAADNNTHRFYLPATMPASDAKAGTFELLVVGEADGRK